MAAQRRNGHEKFEMVSGWASHVNGKKPGVVRGIAAFTLVVAMVLGLYLLARWALTDSDATMRGIASLAFVACSGTTVVLIAIALRKRFRA